MQQHKSNFNQNRSDLISSMPQHIPNRNIQLPQNTTFVPESKAERSFHGFPVIYDNFTSIVDPVSLSKSSRQFKERIDPYISNYTQMKEVHLSIHGNQFSKRNMKNFLRICQLLLSDVHNDETKEICEIAKMFQADEIYNKGLAFILANQDPDFNVPDTKYDVISYLVVEGETNLILHDGDLDDSYFEDANNQSYVGNYYKIKKYIHSKFF